MALLLVTMAFFTFQYRSKRIKARCSDKGGREAGGGASLRGDKMWVFDFNHS